jgi:hypothetical protein
LDAVFAASPSRRNIRSLPLAPRHKSLSSLTVQLLKEMLSEQGDSTDVDEQLFCEEDHYDKWISARVSVVLSAFRI